MPARRGDLSAMIRLMKPLHGLNSDPTAGRRRLVADLCRLIGSDLPPTYQTITVEERSNHLGRAAEPVINGHPSDPAATGAMRSSENSTARLTLPRRQAETLERLLAGDGEKQIAAKLGLSRHTVARIRQEPVSPLRRFQPL